VEKSRRLGRDETLKRITLDQSKAVWGRLLKDKIAQEALGQLTGEKANGRTHSSRQTQTRAIARHLRQLASRRAFREIPGGVLRAV
jgi:hypothetical protein